jgi:hypothetical protein
MLGWLRAWWITSLHAVQAATIRSFQDMGHVQVMHWQLPQVCSLQSQLTWQVTLLQNHVCAPQPNVLDPQQQSVQ